MQKRLTRSITDKKVAGVCGGIAKYLNADPSIVRIITAALILCGSIGLWVYILCAIFIPKEGETTCDCGHVHDMRDDQDDRHN